MKIEVYGRDNCVYCNMAKDLLNKKGLQFEQVMVGSDISREEFFAKFPGCKTVPQITIDGQLVGGYDKLTEWMKNYDHSKFLAG